MAFDPSRPFDENACWVLSDKTHVWDVANRPWLLPFIADRAKDPEERDLLRALIRRASAEAPEARPSFDELVAGHRRDACSNAPDALLICAQVVGVGRLSTR